MKQFFVAQELIKKVKLKCCRVKEINKTMKRAIMKNED